MKRLIGRLVMCVGIILGPMRCGILLYIFSEFRTNDVLRYGVRALLFRFSKELDYYKFNKAYYSGHALLHGHK